MSTENFRGPRGSGQAQTQFTYLSKLASRPRGAPQLNAVLRVGT